MKAVVYDAPLSSVTRTPQLNAAKTRMPVQPVGPCGTDVASPLTPAQAVVRRTRGRPSHLSTPWSCTGPPVKYSRSHTGAFPDLPLRTFRRPAHPAPRHPGW